ncbi:MAG: extracellular solute-binding protein [bacterium]|nr:extracellular solute-binding protein [bacterium]
MKRTILLLAIALFGILGCTSEPAENGPIRFWQFWDVAAIQPIIDEFEAANPGIDVELEQLTWQSGLEKIQAAIASGTQPDLCELGSTWLPRFSYEGVLEDLTDVHLAIADDFIMWESAIWQGKVYGLPWVQGSRALFYNTDLFEAAGLDPEKPPKTWDDLLKAAMRINQLGEDVYGFGLNLGERYVLYKKFMAFAWGNGGAILAPDGSVVFNSPENLEALEFYRKLAEYSLKEKQEVLDHTFRNGKLGMQISGAWNLRNYAEEAPDLNYRVALVPRPSKNHGHHASFAGAEMLVIFKNTRQREDALKLARFLQSYEQARKVSMAVKSVFPASKEALLDPMFAEDDRLRVFVQQAMTSHSAPAHPGWIDMEDVINRSIEEVLYGRTDPKESLESAAIQIQSVVERFD